MSRFRRLALRSLAALLATLLALPLLVLLASLLFGWNWARAPLQDWARHHTGRVLLIAGDLDVQPAWPAPRLLARKLSFANPAWGAAPQMVVADEVELLLDLPSLLRGRLALPELRLRRPQVFLEQDASGRKSWLLDLAQSDEGERLLIGRLLLDAGQVHYLDLARQTALVVDLTTPGTDAAGASGAAVAVGDTQGAEPAANNAEVPDGVRFLAQGQFRGEPLRAAGHGGAVLAWLDETVPYPLQVEATLGATRLKASGSVTSLRQFKAIDMDVALSGDSLDSLYVFTGVVLPPTPAYRTRGRLVREGPLWRYGPFDGTVGHSDLAGRLQLRAEGARPLLSGELLSRKLDLADLGPAVGARAAPGKRVLPDLPFDTRSWSHMDADVKVQAQQLLRDRAQWVGGLQMRLQLQDRRLTLDPLDFALAGGSFSAAAELDARQQPLRGHLKAQLRGLLPGRLMALPDPQQGAPGRLDGDVELRGAGPSIGRMLATADGRLHIEVAQGSISRLLMEKTGLHLLEILSLNLSGDESVAFHCARADFQVRNGVMQADALVLDTAVNTLVGSGRIDLADEQLDLTLVPRTKVGSVISLRSPLRVTGTLGQPTVAPDTGRIVARGVGAVVLGLVNPLLALVPLVDTGPGVQGACLPTAVKAPAAAPVPRSR